MCKEYEDNREKLSDLIFQMQEFTEEELEHQFKEIRHGKIEIGRLQTIHDFLDDLREFGVLKFEAGRYRVQKRSAVLA